MQTVNDLLTMYVGAASQHALRTTSVLEEEAASFDNEIVFDWSQLADIDVAHSSTSRYVWVDWEWALRYNETGQHHAG